MMGIAKSKCCNSQNRTEEPISLEYIAKELQRGTYKNVVVMCGAGISTNAGVPDFRSPSIGLYHTIGKIEGLPYPEAVFDGSFFRSNPKPFYKLVSQIYPERLEPTATHRFFTLLHNKGILRRVYTQNIDALEFLAGLPEEKVVEAHGTFQRSYCTRCRRNYDLPWLKNEIFHPKSEDGVPHCEDNGCGGVVRPDVVLFGEALPEVFWSRASQDFPLCDLLLIFGTSLSVAPFNSMVQKPRSGVPRLYINKSKPGSAGFLGWIMGLSASIKFSGKQDLIVQDDCDKTIRNICQINSGWSDELDNITVEILEA